MTTSTFPRLIADVGGTNARFCIEDSQFTYSHAQTLKCKDFKSLAHAVKHYLHEVGMDKTIHSAALAIPTPEVEDVVFMVNSPWQSFSMKQTRREIGIENTIFLNDFHALALSIPFIPKEDLVRHGGIGEPDTTKPIAIVGPGTGLGMATLIRHPLGDYFAIPAEGGRSSFPSVNEEEFEIWRFVHKRFNHVSAERFISGPGLQLIYESLCHINNIPIATLLSPAEITARGVSGECYTCRQSIDIFCRMLGTVASNLAVMVNSFGGVYLGGGIIPQMLEYFMHSEFRCRFEDKGRYRPFLTKMPVYIITHKYPAFLGASYALDTYLNKGYVP